MTALNTGLNKHDSETRLGSTVGSMTVVPVGHMGVGRTCTSVTCFMAHMSGTGRAARQRLFRTVN